MRITVDTLQPMAVEIGATGIRQLAQELRTLLATCRGSVPLDRDFGVSWDMIDKSLPQARQMLIAEIAQQIEKYIPRVKFESIEFPHLEPEESADGLLAAKVSVTIREEYLHEFDES